MIDGPGLVFRTRRRVYRGYMRILDRLDPQFAKHLLTSQREMLLAGKAFFEEEAHHTDKAIQKLDRREEQAHPRIEVVDR